ncbi:MAG TPA: hypothetical protein VK174_08440 [Chitinophagales bacterium]|nr:hypothetical protein [Chitinophagales bacterium]
MKVSTLSKMGLGVCAAILLILSSCKKEDNTTDPPEPPQNTGWTPTKLVKDNSGFTIRYEGDSTAGGSIPGFNSRIIPLDIFKIGPLLFFSYLHERTLQQGTNYSFYGKLFFPNGTLQNESGYTYPSGGIQKPLSSSYKFLYAKSTSTSFGPYVELIDIKAGTSIYGTYNVGTPRYTYTGDVVHDPTPSTPLQRLGGVWYGSNEFVINKQLRRYEDEHIDQATRQNGMKGGVVEPIFNSPNYIAVFIGRDSVFAFVQDTTATPAGAPTWAAPLNGITGEVQQSFVKISSTGNKIGICFHTDQRYVTTISYDVASNTFTKVLDNTLLTYSGTGTDFDIDEFGNAYYTGYAGNGSNTAGVSIYKLDNTGNSLVGMDNFMITGSVELLKHCAGKVYLALSYYQDASGNQKGPQYMLLQQD